jgi:hypothetical protein
LTTVRHIFLSLTVLGLATVFASACASGEAPNLSGLLEQDASAGSGGSGSGTSTPTGGTTSSTGGTTTTTTTGGSSDGSCNVTFCPNTGTGTACCVTANGPCGVDLGNGCVSGTPQDAGP